MKNPINVMRLPEILNSYPVSRSTFYLKLKEGLLPPSIPLGDKAVGYIEHEYQAVLIAMIAGNNKEEIKKLVISLVNDRQQLKQGASNVIS
mgnify:CR=1 FL=1